MQNEQITFLTKKWHVISLVSIIIILIATGAYFYFSYEEQNIHQEKHKELKTIADLKVAQIKNWNKERLADANIISQDPFYSNGLENWLGSKENDYVKSEIIKRFKLINGDSVYSNIILSDTEGKLILALESELQQIDSITASFIKEAVNQKKIFNTDLYRCSPHSEIHLDYIAPVISKKDVVIAVVIFRINPQKFLYPLIEEWPTPSKTSETLITRKDGDSVLFLNELNHQKNTALTLHISLTKKEIPAVQAVLGFKGIFEGKDYRGKDVLAYIQPVPNTNWFMIAKVDRSEVYASLYYKEIVIISFTFLLIVILSLGLFWFYHFRQKNLYKELFVKEKELREYHEEFRTILYSIGDGVITTDTNGKIKQMNAIAEKLTGWNEAEVIGKPVEEVFKIVNEETRTAVNNPAHQVLKEGTIVGLANHTLLISKHGKEIPIADSGAPVRNEQGKIDGVVLVFRDKTVEYEAEKLILQSEARLKRAELASKLGNWELHLNSKLMIASTGAAKIYGVSKNQLEFEEIKKNPLPEYRPMLDNALKSLIENNQPYNVEYKIKTSDTGELKDIHSIAEYDREKNILFGIIQDVTERKRTEAVIRENEEFLNNLLETVPIPVFFKDKNEKYIGANKAFVSLFGYTKEQLIGKRAFDIYTKELAEIYFAQDQEVLKKSGTRVYESLFLGADGISHDVIIYKTTFSREKEKVAGLIGAILDITERKSAEEKLITVNEELQLSRNIVEDNLYQKNKLVEELTKTKEKLEKINSEKDKFFSIIAHDLRNPFHGFIGLTELMSEDINRFSLNELSELSKEMHNNAKNLLKLLVNLLDWARLQQGFVNFNPLKIDLSEIVSQNIDLMIRTGEHKGINIILEVPKDQTVFADETMLNSILRNLLSNAVKFTNKGGKIIVKSKEIENKMVEISISDNGIGIPDILCNKLFKIEEKVGREGTDGEKSTGLGLLLCKEFVEKHSGKIWVESKENNGSTFYFTLPKVN